MAKLTKAEINALAAKLYNELVTGELTLPEIDKGATDFVAKQIKEFEKTDDYKVLKKYGVAKSFAKSKIIKPFAYKGQSYVLKYPSNGRATYVHLPNGHGTIYRTSQLPTSITQYAIANELIIQQIEITNLDQLINTVKDIFSKKIKAS